MPVHQIVFGIIADQAESIEAHNFAQAAGKVMDQSVQIAVRHDRFSNCQERLVVLTRGKRRFLWCSIVHVENPQIGGQNSPLDRLSLL
jgi:hypothetical protein